MVKCKILQRLAFFKWPQLTLGLISPLPLRQPRARNAPERGHRASHLPRVARAENRRKAGIESQSRRGS
jgi:hypothetical protein